MRQDVPWCLLRWDEHQWEKIFWNQTEGIQISKQLNHSITLSSLLTCSEPLVFGFFVSIRWTQLHHPDKVAVKIKMHYACKVSETQKVLSSCYIFYWNIYNIEMQLNQVFKLLWVLFRGCQWWWAWGVVCSRLCGRAVSVWTIPWGSWGLSKRRTTGLRHWSLIANNLSQQQLCLSIWPIPNHSSLERREKSFVHRLLRQQLSSVRWNQLNQFPTAI